VSTCQVLGTHRALHGPNQLTPSTTQSTESKLAVKFNYFNSSQTLLCSALSTAGTAGQQVALPELLSTFLHMTPSTSLVLGPPEAAGPAVLQDTINTSVYCLPS
jgi:hypothetical protein